MKKFKLDLIMSCILYLFFAANAHALLGIATYNTWGLPSPISKFKKTRMKGLCEKLKTLANIDVILLQEVWMKMDRARLKNCGFEYAADRDSGTLDSGLLILSRHPIIDTYRITYSDEIHGNPIFKPIYNDWERLSRKSLLFAKISHPHHGDFWVANTHLASNHYKRGRTYANVRRSQLIEASYEIATLNENTVLGGDINVSPFGLGYEKNWQLIAELFPGFQTLSNENSFCSYCTQNPNVSKDEGRLDHLFAKGFTPLREEKLFSEPGEVFSDHFGILTTYK